MVKNKEDFYSSVLSDIQNLKSENTELNDLLNPYEAVFEVSRHVWRSFKPDLGAFNADLCRGRNSKGFAVIAVEDIKIPKRQIQKTAEELVRIIQSKNEEAIPKTFKVSSLLDHHEQLIKGLMEDNLIIEELSKELGIDHSTFGFLIQFTFSPFLKKYAEGREEIIGNGSTGFFSNLKNTFKK